MSTITVDTLERLTKFLNGLKESFKGTPKLEIKPDMKIDAARIGIEVRLPFPKENLQGKAEELTKLIGQIGKDSVTIEDQRLHLILESVTIERAEHQKLELVINGGIIY